MLPFEGLSGLSVLLLAGGSQSASALTDANSRQEETLHMFSDWVGGQCDHPGMHRHRIHQGRPHVETQAPE